MTTNPKDNKDEGQPPESPVVTRESITELPPEEGKGEDKPVSLTLPGGTKVTTTAENAETFKDQGSS